MLEGAGFFAVFLVTFAIQTIVTAGLLWCAMKILSEEGTFVALIIACVISSIISAIIPFVGPLLGFFVLIFLITKFTSAGGFTAILMVIVSWAIAVAITLGLIVLLGGAALQFG